MGQVVKGLENNANEIGCKKADIEKLLRILKISKPAESPFQVLMLVSDTIRFVFWMGAPGQCGK